MKSIFKVNHCEGTIIASKNALKKASIPGSPEYNELLKLLKQNPTYSVCQKEVKKAEGKDTQKGFKKDLIEAYLAIQKNADLLLKQYAEAFKLGGFGLARKWFRDTFEGITVDMMQAEIIAAVTDEEQTNSIKELKAAG